MIYTIIFFLSTIVPFLVIAGAIVALIYVIVKQVEKKNKETFEDRDN